MSSDVKNGKRNSQEFLVNKREISWPKVLLNIHINVFLILSLFSLFEATFTTIFFSVLLICLGVIGMTAGAHRLWAHHSYEANLGVRIFLMLCQTLAGQGSIHDWVVKHRIHHKYINTEDDPCLVHKGFLESHIVANCYVTTKRDEELMKEIDTQDLENDSVVAFQKKFYWLLLPIVAILLPVNAPMEYWGDSLLSAILVAGIFRYTITCHLSWLMYSAFHIWGLKPNDKYPADTILVFILTKSHWIKFHYIIPWDYQVGEFGGYGDGWISSVIRIFASLGWASELRTVSSDVIKQAVYNATITGKTVNECVLELTESNKSKLSTQDHFHSAKFL